MPDPRISRGGGNERYGRLEKRLRPLIGWQNDLSTWHRPGLPGSFLGRSKSDCAFIRSRLRVLGVVPALMPDESRARKIWQLITYGVPGCIDRNISPFRRSLCSEQGTLRIATTSLVEHGEDVHCIYRTAASCLLIDSHGDFDFLIRRWVVKLPCRLEALTAYPLHRRCLHSHSGLSVHFHFTVQLILKISKQHNGKIQELVDSF